MSDSRRQADLETLTENGADFRLKEAEDLDTLTDNGADDKQAKPQGFLEVSPKLDWTIKPAPFYVKHASFSGKVSDLYQGQIVGTKQISLDLKVSCHEIC